MTIQEKIAIEFNLFAFWGLKSNSSFKEKIRAASHNAYRDLCRTIEFSDNYKPIKKANFKRGDKTREEKRISDKRQKLRESVEDLFVVELPELINLCDQSKFNIKHDDLCNKIIEFYKNATNPVFSYGQAQK